MCGECCRAGYDVHINKIDAQKWKKMEKNELLEHFTIRLNCISINDGTELNSEDGKTIKMIRANYSNSDQKIQELVEFIRENHLYCGKSCFRQYWKTVVPEFDYDPILVPKSYDVMIKGFDLGLEYIIKTDISGVCPFLNLNLCSIHDFKPMGCKKFPYEKDRCLRKDELFLSVCKGLKKIKQI